MTINQVKSIVDLLTAKYQMGYLSGKDFNNLFRISELAQLSFLIGNLHQYNPGRPVPRVGLGMNKQISERLSPFRVTIQYPISSADGIFQKPVDMIAVESVNGSDGREILPVSHKALGRILSSVIWDRAENPVYCEYDTYIKVYHPDIDDAAFDSIIITGIVTPPVSKWAYSVAGDEEVYSQLGSIDPVWSDIDAMEIIGRLCKNYGVPLKDGELMQYGQSVINQGE